MADRDVLPQPARAPSPVDQALFAVIMEAYMHGASTPQGRRPGQGLGADSGISRGLKQAIGSVLIGAAWHRCRVHFVRNVLAVVPKGNQEMLAAAIRTIFANRWRGNPCDTYRDGRFTMGGDRGTSRRSERGTTKDQTVAPLE